jgi:putative hydrolase of the HAD superfamily
VTAPIRAVLFDLDNTLIERDEAFLGWAKWFVRERLMIRDDSDAQMALTLLIDLDMSGYGSKRAMFEAVLEQHPQVPSDPDLLVRDFPSQLRRHLPEPKPETRSFIAAIEQAGIPWGIVTNGSPAQLEKIRIAQLERAGCLVVSGIAGVRKPEPEIFQIAAVELSVDERHILFVGDNPEADILGAARIGMQTAWMQRGRLWPEQFALTPPDHMIDSLADLMWVTSVDVT